MTQPSSSRTLFVLGSGPGIGRSVATLFAQKRYDKLALFARSSDKLEADAAAITNAVGDDRKVLIKTYTVDLVKTADLINVLDQADKDLGLPECVFHNAARVQPSQILQDDVSEIEYDMKINMTALYVVAQRYMPHLINLAAQAPPPSSSEAASVNVVKPALIVTSSLLPHYPNPYVFSLSIAKAAQRSFMESLEQTYRGKGVLIGVINVQGPVAPKTEGQNPPNIAKETWKWFESWNRDTTGKDRFEVVM